MDYYLMLVDWWRIGIVRYSGKAGLILAVTTSNL